MRIIKKYTNRRLYDTTSSAYINLDDLAGLIRGGERITVVDASSGEDLTRQVLLQVILERQGMVAALPPGFLHRLIRLGGDSPWAAMVSRQLAMGLELLDGQVERFEQQFGWMRGAEAGSPPKPAAEEAPVPEAPPEAPAEPAEEELEALRARLAALEGRLK